MEGNVNLFNERQENIRWNGIVNDVTALDWLIQHYYCSQFCLSFITLYIFNLSHLSLVTAIESYGRWTKLTIANQPIRTSDVIHDTIPSYILLSFIKQINVPLNFPDLRSFSFAPMNETRSCFPHKIGNQDPDLDLLQNSTWCFIVKLQFLYFTFIVQSLLCSLDVMYTSLKVIQTKEK